jgi:hypothetical protein
MKTSAPIPRAPVRGPAFFPVPAISAPHPLPPQRQPYATPPAQAHAPAAPQPVALPPGVPMDVDAARQRILGRRLCYNCGKAGHFSATCPSRQKEHLRVADMTIEDMAEIAEVYAAYQDSQNLPAAGEEVEEDFANNQE